MALPFYNADDLGTHILGMGWTPLNQWGNPNAWVDLNGSAQMPERYQTQWGSITPREAPDARFGNPDPDVGGYVGIQDVLRQAYPGKTYPGARVITTVPDPGYNKPSASWASETPGIVQLIDAGLSMLPGSPWGVVSGAAKAGAGFGSGDQSMGIAGLMQAAGGAYSLYSAPAGAVSAGAGADVGWSAGMGGAGEAGLAGADVGWSAGMGGAGEIAYSPGGAAGVAGAYGLSSDALSGVKDFAKNQAIKYGKNILMGELKKGLMGGAGGAVPAMGLIDIARPSVTSNQWGEPGGSGESDPQMMAQAAGEKKYVAPQEATDARQAYLKKYLDNVPARPDFLAEYLA